MTVIAWDGTTLAADRQASNCGLAVPVTKLCRLDDRLVGVTGSFSQAGRYLAWLRDGAVPEMYPKQEAQSECYLFVVHRDGRLERYEDSGWPIVIEHPFFACGSGRDFAMAALHLGCTAERAVEVTCALSHECGFGVDSLRFERLPGSRLHQRRAEVLAFARRPNIWDIWQVRGHFGRGTFAVLEATGHLPALKRLYRWRKARMALGLHGPALTGER